MHGPFLSIDDSCSDDLARSPRGKGGLLPERVDGGPRERSIQLTCALKRSSDVLVHRTILVFDNHGGQGTRSAASHDRVFEEDLGPQPARRSGR